MPWVRLDEKKLRNTGHSRNHPHVLSHRVYGKDGAKWPRISLSIYSFADLTPDAGFTLSASIKSGPGTWWETLHLGIPRELISDVVELMREAEEKLK